MTETVLKPSSHTAPQWQRRGEHVYLEGRAHLDGADALAVASERKWGVGRLRLLVSDDLRAKFDSQRLKLDRALWHGDLEDVKREAARMCTAWRALDAAATAAGAEPLSPMVMETTLSTGTVVSIVPDDAHAHAVKADGRRVQIWTLSEIGRCLDAFPAVVKAKSVIPGATVVGSRPPTDPLEDMPDFEIEPDAIPF